ncbi:flagellar basal-body rod protein FlgF [Chelativorans sp. ZYF759]|uniref:flagellar basal-body rod protein FlgF n=1 Tax=Chelativorans sp. ZYF759 TaxID=2692213 RepID=UPI00145F77B9|nr:flagellar basal-body rod protein FlgF [Chelativorans sp. ZYF759]
MQTGLYVALSSQVALERRLNTIADNVANATTTGFRATGVKFEDVVTGLGQDSMSFVSSGTNFLSTAGGALVQTGNPLDFAVRGDAWFAIQTPEGPVMTRDGRFTMQPDGQLVSIEGHPVLDAGGGEILLNPEGGTPIVAADGAIRQEGQLAGAIGLFDFQPGNDFRRYGNSGIIPQGEPQPIIDQANIGVVQGYLEGSNVDPVLEITRLIQVQRAFEGVSALLRDSESSLRDAIKTLGS